MTASPLAQTPNDMFNAPIAEADPEIAEILDAELSRQQNGLEMIASENFVPRAVLQAQGSVPNTLTSSRTPVPRPTPPSTRRSSNPATRSSASPSTTAATSPMA